MTKKDNVNVKVFRCKQCKSAFLDEPSCLQHFNQKHKNSIEFLILRCFEMTTATFPVETEEIETEDEDEMSTSSLGDDSDES